MPRIVLAALAGGLSFSVQAQERLDAVQAPVDRAEADHSEMVRRVNDSQARAIAELQPQSGDEKSQGESYNSHFTMNSGSRKVFLEIMNDRIGILASQRTTYEEILRMAAESGLSVGQAIGGNIHVFLADQELDQHTRWTIARNLRLQHPDRIRASGLVANLAGTPNFVVIDETIYVRFLPDPFDDNEVRRRLDGIPLENLRRTPYGINEFTFRLDPRSPEDPLAISQQLEKRKDVFYAHPEIAFLLEERGDPDDCDRIATHWEPWCDIGFLYQWHLESTGPPTQESTEDADLDIRKAWDYTIGDESVLIAVLDSSFYLEHPDLEPNLWADPEPGQSNPRRGIDLVDQDHTSLLAGEWDSGHGTSTMGIAGARGGPSSQLSAGGDVGICPRCKLLPIRLPLGVITDDLKKAFQFASDYDADVISMSMGFPLIADSISYDIDPDQVQSVQEAIDELKVELVGIVDNGTVVVFAMSNSDRDNCQENPDSASLESVIAVGGVTSEDRRSDKPDEAMGYGDCMDVLAPTRGGKAGIETTTVTIYSADEMYADYTNNFGGTSASTPMVAGTAALIRHLVPCHGANATNVEEFCLTPLQVQMVLQDTADKVEAGVPRSSGVDTDGAQYDRETGFSKPSASGSTHAYGRINAFEAVRLVAPIRNPAGKGGRAGRDLLIRDHESDWGNTEQGSNILFNSPREVLKQFRSVDIRIDTSPFCHNALSNSECFAELANEVEPVPLTDSRVYVRVRNRGPQMIERADLKLYWAIYGKDEDIPILPATFWSHFPGNANNTSIWHPTNSEVVSGLSYSGASVAGCPDREIPKCLGGTDAPRDEAQVIRFDVESINWDATKEHLTWLAVISSEEDEARAIAGTISKEQTFSVLHNVLWDNNIALWTSKIAENLPPSPPTNLEATD